MSFFSNSAPILIAGPCVIESEGGTLELASALSGLPEARRFDFVFKASYLKDNRSSSQSFRGPGMEKGLEVLSRVKREVGCRVLSDVHCREEVAEAAEVLDVIQIPAFLCRQTRLLEAAGSTGRPVNIKKGQFMSPEGMGFAVEKVRNAGCREVLITERGTVFGYGDLVVDMRSFARMKEFGCPILLDVTHSLQRPGALGERSGGEPRLVPVLARAAAAVPCDGFFIETHFDPRKALSDAASMYPFSHLAELLEDVYKVWELVSKKMGANERVGRDVNAHLEGEL